MPLTYDVGRDSCGRRVRRTETVRGSYKDAERRLIELVSLRDQGVDVAPHGLTVDQFLTRWLDAHNVTDQSKARYEQLIRRHVREGVGGTRLTALKPLHVQTLLSNAESKVSTSTAHDVFVLLKMALSQAVRWQLLARNPADAVERPKVDEAPAMRVFTPQEIEKLLLAAEGTDFSALISLALSTGIRRGEVLALKWGMVSLDDGTITISENARFRAGVGVVYGPPKTRKSRRLIPLAHDTAEMLRELRQLQLERRLRWGLNWQVTDLVFTNEIGEPLPIGSFNLRFSKIVARAGLPACRFHDLRHTHGTLLAGAGVNAKVVSDRLGHSDVKFTLNRYVTPTQEHQKAAAEVFSTLLRQAR